MMMKRLQDSYSVKSSWHRQAKPDALTLTSLCQIHAAVTTPALWLWALYCCNTFSKKDFSAQLTKEGNLYRLEREVRPIRTDICKKATSKCSFLPTEECVIARCQQQFHCWGFDPTTLQVSPSTWFTTWSVLKSDTDTATATSMWGRNMS